jgi:catechol 2,3-dioxygenase-like lactoylglutathione lyase family enzyme
VPPEIDELVIADEPAAWRAVGFAVDGAASEVGSVRLGFAGHSERRGIVEWSLRGASTLELDGLPTIASERLPAAGAEHRNGVVSIDHVVVMTPDLDRTVDVLRKAGFDFRRLREGATPGGSVRQAFFRMGEVILEVVQAPEGMRLAADPSGPARLWGISFLVPDLDATGAVLGDLLGKARDAVQPGRRIATLRREAGLGPAVAFMTPGPRAI